MRTKRPATNARIFEETVSLGVMEILTEGDPLIFPEVGPGVTGVSTVSHSLACQSLKDLYLIQLGTAQVREL